MMEQLDIEAELELDFGIAEEVEIGPEGNAPPPTPPTPPPMVEITSPTSLEVNNVIHQVEVIGITATPPPLPLTLRVPPPLSPSAYARHLAYRFPELRLIGVPPQGQGQGQSQGQPEGVGLFPSPPQPPLWTHPPLPHPPRSVVGIEPGYGVTLGERRMEETLSQGQGQGPGLSTSKLTPVPSGGVSGPFRKLAKKNQSPVHIGVGTDPPPITTGSQEHVNFTPLPPLPPLITVISVPALSPSYVLPPPPPPPTMAQEPEVAADKAMDMTGDGSAATGSEVAPVSKDGPAPAPKKPRRPKAKKTTTKTNLSPDAAEGGTTAQIPARKPRQTKKGQTGSSATATSASGTKTPTKKPGKGKQTTATAAPTTKAGKKTAKTAGVTVPPLPVAPPPPPPPEEEQHIMITELEQFNKRTTRSQTVSRTQAPIIIPIDSPSKKRGGGGGGGKKGPKGQHQGQGSSPAAKKKINLEKEFEEMRAKAEATPADQGRSADPEKTLPLELIVSVPTSLISTKSSPPPNPGISTPPTPPTSAEKVGPLHEILMNPSEPQMSLIQDKEGSPPPPQDKGEGEPLEPGEIDSSIGTLTPPTPTPYYSHPKRNWGSGAAMPKLSPMIAYAIPLPPPLATAHSSTEIVEENGQIVVEDLDKNSSVEGIEGVDAAAAAGAIASFEERLEQLSQEIQEHEENGQKLILESESQQGLTQEEEQGLTQEEEQDPSNRREFEQENGNSEHIPPLEEGIPDEDGDVEMEDVSQVEVEVRIPPESSRPLSYFSSLSPQSQAKNDSSSEYLNPTPGAGEISFDLGGLAGSNPEGQGQSQGEVDLNDTNESETTTLVGASFDGHHEQGHGKYFNDSGEGPDIIPESQPIPDQNQTKSGSNPASPDVVILSQPTPSPPAPGVNIKGPRPGQKRPFGNDGDAAAAASSPEDGGGKRFSPPPTTGVKNPPNNSSSVVGPHFGNFEEIGTNPPTSGGGQGQGQRVGVASFILPDQIHVYFQGDEGMETPRSTRSTGIFPRMNFDFRKIAEDEENATLPSPPKAINLKIMARSKVTDTADTSIGGKGGKMEEEQPQPEVVMIDSQNENKDENLAQESVVPEESVKGKKAAKAKGKAVDVDPLEVDPLDPLAVEGWMMAGVIKEKTNNEGKKRGGKNPGKKTKDAEDYASIQIRTLHNPQPEEVKGILRRSEGAAGPGDEYQSPGRENEEVSEVEQVSDAVDLSGEGKRNKRSSECQLEHKSTKRVKFANPMTFEREYEIDEHQPRRRRRSRGQSQDQEDPREPPPQSGEWLTAVTTKRSLKGSTTNGENRRLRPTTTKGKAGRPTKTKNKGVAAATAAAASAGRDQGSALYGFGDDSRGRPTASATSSTASSSSLTCSEGDVEVEVDSRPKLKATRSSNKSSTSSAASTSLPLSQGQSQDQGQNMAQKKESTSTRTTRNRKGGVTANKKFSTGDMSPIPQEDPAPLTAAAPEVGPSSSTQKGPESSSLLNRNLSQSDQENSSFSTLDSSCSSSYNNSDHTHFQESLPLSGTDFTDAAYPDLDPSFASDPLTDALVGACHGSAASAHLLRLKHTLAHHGITTVGELCALKRFDLLNRLPMAPAPRRKGRGGGWEGENSKILHFVEVMKEYEGGKWRKDEGKQGKGGKRKGGGKKGNNSGTTAVPDPPAIPTLMNEGGGGGNVLENEVNRLDLDSGPFVVSASSSSAAAEALILLQKGHHHEQERKSQNKTLDSEMNSFDLTGNSLLANMSMNFNVDPSPITATVTTTDSGPDPASPSPSPSYSPLLFTSQESQNEVNQGQPLDYEKSDERSSNNTATPTVEEDSSDPMDHLIHSADPAFLPKSYEDLEKLRQKLNIPAPPPDLNALRQNLSWKEITDFRMSLMEPPGEAEEAEFEQVKVDRWNYMVKKMGEQFDAPMAHKLYLDFMQSSIDVTFKKLTQSSDCNCNIPQNGSNDKEM